jgi:hypothetical protein
VFEGKAPVSTFFRQMLFDREYEICTVSQDAPRKKKRLQENEKQTQAQVLESLRNLEDGRVEREMSRIRREVKKGKWTEEAGTLTRALLVMLRRSRGDRT